MKCPICEIHTKYEWLGKDSFQCKKCGFYFSDPVEGARLEYLEATRKKEDIRCPECGELTEGMGGNLEGLNNIYSYKDEFDNKTRSGFFHPECWKARNKSLENQQIRFHKQTALIEAVAEVECPNCHEVGIYLESTNYYPDLGMLRPYWYCPNCETTIDKHWLMKQIRHKGGTKE